MKKPFGVFNKNSKRFVEFFQYPTQADKFINKVLGGSKRFVVVDKRKK